MCAVRRGSPTSGVITLEIPSRYRPAVANLLPRGNNWSLTGLPGSSGAQPSPAEARLGYQPTALRRAPAKSAH